MVRITGILRPLLRQQQRQILRQINIYSSSSTSFLPSKLASFSSPATSFSSLSVPTTTAAAAACLFSSFSPASRTFSSAAESPSNMVQVTSDDQLSESLKKATDESFPAIFYFTAAWCGPCGFLWPNIKKLSDSLPQVGSKPTIQNLGISSVATRHFSSKGFRPGGSNFGSIRSGADWFHLLNKKKEWYLRLKKKKACRLLLKSQFLKKLHSSIQEKDLKDLDADKKFKYKKGCLGSSFAERNRMKRHFFHSGILNLYIKEKGMNDKNLNHPTQTRRSIDSSYKLSDLIYCCASSYQFSMKKREGRSKTKIKKIELPTHISEVNHKTLQAVISYAPTYSELPGYVKRRLGSGAVTTR